MISNRPPAVESVGHPPVVPCELPDGIQLVYTDDRSRRHAIALDEARTVDFGPTRPFREPPASLAQRNFPGWWWSVTTRSHVVYESWLERHHIIKANRDARVTGIAGQPFALIHLLWLGRLIGDLSRPLGNGTILAASADPLEAT